VPKRLAGTARKMWIKKSENIVRLPLVDRVFNNNSLKVWSAPTLLGPKVKKNQTCFCPRCQAHLFVPDETVFRCFRCKFVITGVVRNVFTDSDDDDDADDNDSENDAENESNNEEIDGWEVLRKPPSLLIDSDEFVVIDNNDVN